MSFFRLKIVYVLILITTIVNAQESISFKNHNPTEYGFSKEKLDSLTEFLKNSGSSSLMILVNGKKVYEWGDTDRKHLIHSIRKALLNSLYGIYIDEGIIDTTETIRELKIDDLVPLSDNEKSATIIDLLKSRSGIYHHAAAVSDNMLKSMPERNSHIPNEAYYYNNWGFNVLGHILELKTGKSLYTLFNEHIARPLNMSYSGQFTQKIVNSDVEDFKIPEVDGFYQYEMHKSKYPAYHFRLSTKDLARYGQLYINQGKWQNKQVVPENWITYSTKPHNITYEPAGIAYGILWGVLMKTKNRSASSFHHTGTGVHMLAVYPKSNMVLVHRVDTEKEYSFGEKEFYEMIDLVWDAKIN